MLALGCDHVAGLPPASQWNEAWQAARWHDTLAIDWKFKDHIHLGEARALNLWLEITSRLPLVRGTRIVDLCGSQVATHAFAKGRSHAYAVKRLLRKRASLEIVADVSLLVGWVSTKVQPADRLSRWRIVQGLMRGLRFFRRTPQQGESSHTLIVGKQCSTRTRWRLFFVPVSSSEIRSTCPASCLRSC